MTARTFGNVSDLERDSKSSRRTAKKPPPERLPPLPAITSGSEVDGASGITPGRSVDPRAGSGFGVLTGQSERRPYGRAKDFIESIEAIADFDPQASQATTNFLRLMNPGHEVKVFTGKPGPKEAPEGGKGQALVDSRIADIAAEYGGGSDQLHDVLSYTIVTHGAIAGEIAPTQDLSELEDWYPINPLRLDFRRFPVFDGDKIGKLMLCQKNKAGKFVLVNPNQVFYQGLDPAVDKPYGRPPLMAALQTVLGKSVMLNDLRAVAHNQGYPRIDVKILWESLAKAAPPSLRDGGRDKDLVEWMKTQLSSIAGEYNKLNVDDTYVHYDWVDIGMVGPNYAASSFDFKGLEQILTRQINSALKTLPILLGYNEAVSETHGSIQWQIQVMTIMALRKHVKRLMERMWNATFRLYGIDAFAKIIYTPTRTEDRKFEAEAAFLEAKTFEVHQRMGWAEGNEIAQELYGHDAVGDPIYTGATGKEPGETEDQAGTKSTSKTKVPTLVELALRDDDNLEQALEDGDVVRSKKRARAAALEEAGVVEEALDVHRRAGAIRAGTKNGQH